MFFPINLLPPFSGQLLKFKCNLLVIKCINLKRRFSVTPAPPQPLWASSSGLDLARQRKPPTWLLSSQIRFACFWTSWRGIIQYELFCVWLLWFNIFPRTGTNAVVLYSAALYSLSLLWQCPIMWFWSCITIYISSTTVLFPVWGYYE